MYHKFLLLTMDQILFILRTEIEGENILETLRTCMLLVKIEWRGKRRFSKETKQKEYINNWVDQRSTLVPEST
jgi:hypothetical protein